MTTVLDALPPVSEVEYPESDGQPLGETEYHIDALIELRTELRDFFAEVPDVHVGGNLFLYYEEGNPRAVVCPDVFVTFGMDKGKRRIYKLWQEGVAPSVVIEVTSRSTRREDEKKVDLYTRLGVKEYYRFDPLREYLRPPLLGLELRPGREPHPPLRMASAADGSLESRVLGLTLVPDKEQVRLLVTATGAPLLHSDEIKRRQLAAEAAQQAAEAAQRSAEAAQRSAEAAQRSAEERAHQEAQARRTAEDAQRAAEARAERETSARQAAERELERLRREVARLSK